MTLKKLNTEAAPRYLWSHPLGLEYWVPVGNLGCAGQDPRLPWPAVERLDLIRQLLPRIGSCERLTWFRGLIDLIPFSVDHPAVHNATIAQNGSPIFLTEKTSRPKRISMKLLQFDSGLLCLSHCISIVHAPLFQHELAVSGRKCISFLCILGQRLRYRQYVDP